MKRFAPIRAAWPILTCAVVASGCGSEPVLPQLNQEPNTRISAGPPEATDTGYQVNIFWFGWDEDGFVDHYEIAWETPDEWLGPIFTNDSLFVVAAQESCCVDPLSDFSTVTLHDSVYEQFHTIYVRAVDDRGVVDPTPAVRSFNSKTIAPYAQITFGPRDSGEWGQSVEFKWTAFDDDQSSIVGYRRALATKEQFHWDRPGLQFTTGNFLAWLDTLTTFPIGPQSNQDSTIWENTTIDSVVYPLLAHLDGTGASHLYLFAVRAIDDAGAVERVLDLVDNARRFRVLPRLSGPRLFVTSPTLGRWVSGDPVLPRDIFAAQGLRFQWRARPGASGAQIAGYSYAVEDTTVWSPPSINSTEWPVQPQNDDEVLWFPDAGTHSFFVRATDRGGFTSVLEMKLEIFSGPMDCLPEDRILLIVLDTEDNALSNNSVFPFGYSDMERNLISYWFEGFSFQIFETKGINPVDVGLLNCARSTVWLSSSDIRTDGNVLFRYHTTPPNPLPSYLSSGGNLLLLGIQPLEAMRYFEQVEGAPSPQAPPVVFSRTITDTSLVPHWVATHFGVSRVEETVGNVLLSSMAHLRMRRARSAVPEYPDLIFDPLTTNQGPLLRGFGYYDRGIVPLVDPITGQPQSERIYFVDGTDLACGVRRLRGPQAGGSSVYLGLHPYFVERPAFRQFIRTVLQQFGEALDP